MCSIWAKNGRNPECDGKNKSKDYTELDYTELAVGGKMNYTMAKPLEDNVKKAIVTLREASYMVKDIRKGLNVPADTVYEVQEQGSSLCGPYQRPMLPPGDPLSRLILV